MADLTPRTRSESFLNGEDLEPITRREHFYAGRENELPEGHQEPETREEWFIKKYREAGDVTVESLSITENGTYTAPSGKAYSPVSVNVPLPSNAYLLKTIEHEQVATFTDGTDNFLKSLEVAIEPQQDLHGYDSPWVGGSGKNKLPMVLNDIKSVNTSGTWSGNTYTQNGIAYTVNTDSDDNILSIKVNGTSTSPSYLVLTNALNTTTLTGCIVNGLVANVSSIIYRISSTSDFTSLQDLYNNYTIEDNGNNRRFTIRVNGSATNEIIYPMIRLASVTDATFAPYSNECPISGWSEVNVTVADDLENPTVSNVYTIDLDGTRYGGKLDVVNGVVTPAPYYASYNGEALTGEWISDRDKYEVGTTPTIGAQVVNIGASDTPVSITPTIIKSLQGDNNFFASTGEIELLQYWGEVS